MHSVDDSVNEYGTLVEWYWRGKTKGLVDFPPQIPH